MGHDQFKVLPEKDSRHILGHNSLHNSLLDKNQRSDIDRSSLLTCLSYELVVPLKLHYAKKPIPHLKSPGIFCPREASCHIGSAIGGKQCGKDLEWPPARCS